MSNSFGDIYFEENYLRLYEANNEGIYNCFNYENKNRVAIYPFLKNSVNELGYILEDKYYDIQGAYGYNGVLSNSMDLDFIESFYKEFNLYCKKNKIIAEFTRFHPILRNHEFSKRHIQIFYDRETVALDLTQDYEQIWLNEYTSKNRNMIRKARKEGYTSEVVEYPSISHINTFIDIYIHSMKMAEANEYYFFNNIFFYKTFSLLKDHAILINVLDKNRSVVCSSIFFHYGDYFHYHLSGRSKEANNAVNNLLLDDAIKLAQKKGAKKFHFGGGRTSEANDSLLKFKGSFSKVRLPFYIGKKIHNQQIYDEVVRQWENNEPDKKLKYMNHLLKYRY